MIFVNSMSDLFHPGLDNELRDEIMAVILACAVFTNYNHTFQILTKRYEEMLRYFTEVSPVELLKRLGKAGNGWIHPEDTGYNFYDMVDAACVGEPGTEHEWEPWGSPLWPLPNLWMGISASGNDDLNKGASFLVQTPAKIRFVSLEPILEKIEDEVLGGFLDPTGYCGGCKEMSNDCWCGKYPRDEDRDGAFATLDQVIVGCESGPKARHMDAEWARSIRDLCKETGVAFFMKQLPGPRGKPLKLLHEFPEDLRIQEYPNDKREASTPAKNL
jgi:protein gp37